ncbi:MAG TPA: DUF3040 domain-containing protein [Pseudonocardiaceae bacterium]|nr:DUF3040 domain-containing protein [Pseudonocardiaceae bacterium]
MLSDHERDVLHEIQAGLLVEDPGFAQSFDTETQSLATEAQSLATEAQRPHRGSPDWTRWLYTILLVLSSTYAVIMLLAESPISALALAAMAGVSWEARRRHDGTSHQRS